MEKNYRLCVVTNIVGLCVLCYLVFEVQLKQETEQLIQTKCFSCLDEVLPAFMLLCNYHIRKYN